MLVSDASAQLLQAMSVVLNGTIGLNRSRRATAL